MAGVVQVALVQAELALARTRVRAPRAGTVTNLDVCQGDWASAGQPRLALVGAGDLWIYAYFKETKLPAIHVGDAVDIRLMAGGTHLQGQVKGIATGIADTASPTADNRLADVQPAFNEDRSGPAHPGTYPRIAPDSLPEGTGAGSGHQCHGAGDAGALNGTPAPRRPSQPLTRHDGKLER